MLHSGYRNRWHQVEMIEGIRVVRVKSLIAANRGTVMRTVRYLHSFKFFGQTPRKLIEIAAGWSILLVATGIYLWWPRNGRGGVVSRCSI